MLRGSRGRLAVALIAHGKRRGSDFCAAESRSRHRLKAYARVSLARREYCDFTAWPRRPLRQTKWPVRRAPGIDGRSGRAGGSRNECSTPEIVAVAPFLYIVGRVENTPVVVVGTWLEEVARDSIPPGKLKGNGWTIATTFGPRAFVGRNVASSFIFPSGAEFDLEYRAARRSSRRRGSRFRRCGRQSGIRQSCRCAAALGSRWPDSAGANERRSGLEKCGRCSFKTRCDTTGI